MKVKNFAGFMKSRKLNETSSDWDADYGLGAGGNIDSDKNLDMDGPFGKYGTSETEYDFGANPEEEEVEMEDDEATDSDETEEDKEVTLEDLKAMLDDLTERVNKLEGGEEEEEKPEGEEEEEKPEGEEVPEGEEEEEPAK